MKNGTNAKSKTSSIAKSTNNYILVTMLIQFILSCVASVITSTWTYYKGAEYEYIYPTIDGETSNRN